MGSLGAADLLALWERGQRRHALDRGLLLFAVARPELSPEILADRPLGERNVALIRLRRALFGPAIPSYVDCPSCRERLDLTLDVEVFLAHAAADPSAAVDVAGQHFRLPTSRDLAAISSAADEEEAALELARRCQMADAGEQTLSVPLSALVPDLEACFEAADPLLEPSLDVACEVCGYSWLVPFDIGTLLWDEIEASARGLLAEVHTLARAYGWSEREILALSARRRAAYLGMLT
ncbi:hypothetical protein E0E50_01490 [Azotobacter chroococcum subsp. isscasi]|uniref:hypothetical protein n=1 Tax=Azotobacter chroococcum TaxID=353 RepID=UPI001039B73B|nr:hypothetical protein [Azotobacter chroococcum]TBW12969.1 hypothetical protein E0E50_01490 [Azotobacter chroococcum subsp. isscasi]